MNKGPKKFRVEGVTEPFTSIKSLSEFLNVTETRTKHLLRTSRIKNRVYFECNNYKIYIPEVKEYKTIKYEKYTSGDVDLVLIKVGGVLQKTVSANSFSKRKHIDTIFKP